MLGTKQGESPPVGFGVVSSEAYRGLSLPEALLEQVQQHGSSRTLHLSQYEVMLLEVAADWLDRNGCRVRVPRQLDSMSCESDLRERIDAWAMLCGEIRFPAGRGLRELRSTPQEQ